MGKQIKLGLLKTGGVVTAIAPLVTVIAINWNDYVVASNGNPLKLTMGGMIAVFLIACSTIGRLKMPGKITFYFMLLVMVILLEPVLADLKLLCACALGGEVVNSFTFNIFTKNYQETITMEKQAKITKNVFSTKEENKKSNNWKGLV